MPIHLNSHSFLCLHGAHDYGMQVYFVMFFNADIKVGLCSPVLAHVLLHTSRSNHVSAARSQLQHGRLPFQGVQDRPGSSLHGDGRLSGLRQAE